jgi:prepilin-type N-terminal cleavage/methylation domain-containing protein
MGHTERARTGQAGFTLAELLIAMLIVLIIMGATMRALTDAYRSNETAKGILGVNNNLRIAADLIVRDFIQVGQGLPTARIVQVPNGAGAARIQLPHPQDSACTQWPAGITAIPAVTAGPGCGPVIDGVATDVVTTLAVDASLEGVPVSTFDLAGHRATLALPPVCATGGPAPNCTTFQAGTFVAGMDISAASGDDVHVGDLIMFTKGSLSALAYVTAFDGTQTVTFAGGDPMSLNQFAAALNGTVDDLATTPPCSAVAVGTPCDPNPPTSATVTPNSATASRIRMISYYLDNTLDPTTPRLIRHMNWGDPALQVNRRGNAVGLAIDNLQFTYDMVDGVTNPSAVRMVAADLDGTGRCSPNPCSPNQIRKINVYLTGRSTQQFTQTRRYFRNELSTQVSLRSLALVDRYR